MTPHHQIVAMLQAQPSPKPTPLVSPSCEFAPDLCGWVTEKTGDPRIAQGSYLFVVKPLQIALIIALAVLTRFLINRTIDRLVRATTNDTSPTLLRPLREKMPDALRNAALMPERRRQRAEALGSVLRSITSAVVFVVAVMTILGQLGLELAPLLASAGIAGLAIGFGAQNLVKDFITGLFMLLEDQYGVGDVIDVGPATGTVEAVGLRITTIRDAQGVVWYIRNGEILRVGNKSQGWAMVIVDVPVGFAGIEGATEILRAAAARLAADPQWSEDLIEAPAVLGVEQITADGAVLRTTAKTTSEAQWRVARELRWRLSEALERAGVASKAGAGRVYLPAAGADPEAAPAAAEWASAPAAERASETAVERASGAAVGSAAASPEIARGLTESGRGDTPQ